MKIIVLIFAICIKSFVCYSQEFLGIKPSGNKDYTIKQFVEKGFKFEYSLENASFLNGKINGNDFDLIIFNTPKSKQVYKFLVSLPKLSSFYSLKTQFDVYKVILIEKYGKPSDIRNHFFSPYEEGDGNELVALKSDRAFIAAYWYFPNSEIELKLSPTLETQISYQNNAGYKLKEKESNEINNETF
jgi:hypothetical protein